MQTMISKLSKMFPESLPVSTIEWNGNAGGIWFRGSEDYLATGERVFDYYINPCIAAVLESAGWYAEPHDAGTCMAYPI